MEPVPPVAAVAPARSLTLRVRRWGDRLAVVLPRQVAEDLGLAEGVLVDARLRKRRS